MRRRAIAARRSAADALQPHRTRGARRDLALAEHAARARQQAAGEAMAARAVFDAVAAGELEYFKPVAAMPGFPKALARTLHELRLAGVTADRLAARGPAERRPRPRCWRASKSSSIDRRSTIARRCYGSPPRRGADGPMRWAGMPIVLLDVTLDSRAEERFVAAIAAPRAGRARHGAGRRSARRQRARPPGRRRPTEVAVAADCAPTAVGPVAPAALHLHQRAAADPRARR